MEINTASDDDGFIEVTRKRHANKEDGHRTPAATKRRLNADSPITSPDGADKRACVNHTPPQVR